MDRHDDRKNLHAVWQRSPWSNRPHTQTQCDENLGFESAHLLPHTEEHPRNDPARDVDAKRHKEEMMTRMLSDANDREKLRNKLEESINPLDSAQHPEEGILNIVNGRISPDEVNVDRALEIGETTMKTFELSWPTGFNSPISKD